MTTIYSLWKERDPGKTEDTQYRWADGRHKTFTMGAG